MKTTLTKKLFITILIAASAFTANAQMDVSAVVTNITCSGDNDGAIDIDVTGNTGTLTFDWNNGFATTEDLSGLSGGIYTVIVSDFDGTATATISATYVVNEPAAITVAGNVTNETCLTGDGAIDITVSGGTPGYNFLWDDFSTDEDRTGLISGTYTVFVSDYNNCTATASFVISQQPGMDIKFSFVQNSGCGNAGKLTAIVTGGTGTYTYWWSPCGGGSPLGIANKINAQSCQCYMLTVNDGNCDFTRSYTVPKVNIALPTNCSVKANLTCNTDFGSASAYKWNNNNLLNTQTLNCISNGNYQVLVNNTNGDAYKTCNKAITTVPLSVTDVRKNAGGGRIIFTLTGGCAPYNAVWSVSPAGTITTFNSGNITNGQIKKLSGLRTYTVTVTDACGHTATATSTTTLRFENETDDNAVVNLFELSPNPSNGIFTINFSDALIGEAQITIYNLTGQVVLQKQFVSNDTNSLQIDLTGQPKGIYGVKIITAESLVRTQKLVIN